MTEQPDAVPLRDRDLAPVAVLIGDPTRAAMLAALAEGHALPADRAARSLGEARTCYDHLAGRRGVQLRDRLLAADALRRDDRDHRLTATGRERMREIGVDVGAAEAARRVFARSCVDWTQRRPHLAGALPSAITARLVGLGWLSPGTGRGLRVAAGFDRRLGEWLPDPGAVSSRRARCPRDRGGSP
ncbi:MAG TPA: hypothetical protein VGH99_05905 [Pseudonocardia sp.]|jgi:hypothetical protein